MNKGRVSTGEPRAGIRSGSSEGVGQTLNEGGRAFQIQKPDSSQAYQLGFPRLQPRSGEATGQVGLLGDTWPAMSPQWRPEDHGPRVLHSLNI